jgi:hypothetical protein
MVRAWAAPHSIRRPPTSAPLARQRPVLQIPLLPCIGPRSPATPPDSHQSISHFLFPLQPPRHGPSPTGTGATQMRFVRFVDAFPFSSYLVHPAPSRRAQVPVIGQRPITTAAPTHSKGITPTRIAPGSPSAHATALMDRPVERRDQGARHTNLRRTRVSSIVWSTGTIDRLASNRHTRHQGMRKKRSRSNWYKLR